MRVHLQRTKWLYAACLVLIGNIWLYTSQMGQQLIRTNNEATYVVLGSLIDLAIVLPILLWLHLKKKSWKVPIALVATGLIIARLLIPAHLIQPFAPVTTAVILLELIIVAIELLLILTLLWHVPTVKKVMETLHMPTPFALQYATAPYHKNNPIIAVLLSEFLMFYYALLGWRKQAPQGYTLYKNSMYIPVMIMILHAIVLEGIGFHWLLHDRFPVAAYILLAFHIYSVIFVLADMQAMRLTPTVIKNNTLYITYGLMKRINIDINNIKEIHQDLTPPKKTTILFHAPNFEEQASHFVIELKESQQATLAMGFTKQVRYIGIQADSPAELQQAILEIIQ